MPWRHSLTLSLSLSLSLFVVGRQTLGGVCGGPYGQGRAVQAEGDTVYGEGACVQHHVTRRRLPHCSPPPAIRVPRTVRTLPRLGRLRLRLRECVCGRGGGGGKPPHALPMQNDVTADHLVVKVSRPV
jgi:hypothetical protein